MERTRLDARAKRFLTPLRKYEIFLQLVRQEVTVIEVADHWQVDHGVIMRIPTVAMEGALEALSKSRSGRREKERDMELLVARADAASLGDALKEMAVQLRPSFRATSEQPVRRQRVLVLLVVERESEAVVGVEATLRSGGSLRSSDVRPARRPASIR